MGTVLVFGQQFVAELGEIRIHTYCVSRAPASICAIQ
jgi:hypothetical protein